MDDQDNATESTPTRPTISLIVLGCAQTDSLFESTLQRFHDWLKMGKSSKSSNTTFCILERLVKGKKECLVAVLKPHKNQIQPTSGSF